MKSLFRVFCLAGVLAAAPGAHAGGISDTGTNAYWGADGHGYNDVIGSSLYDIKGAKIERVGDVLYVTVKTSFAGNAGSQASQTLNNKGIGYGDVFLSETWNPFGADAHHSADKASNGTNWSYGFSLDNRWSNTGGSFKLYELNGTNSQDIQNSETYMKSSSTFRNGQAVSVNTASSTVQNTTLTGTWTVLANYELRFSINAANTDLINFSSFAMHWGETCQNDVVEGLVGMPLPNSLPLLGVGLGAMLLLRRRQTGARI